MYTDVNVIVDFVDGRKIFFFDKLLILNLCNQGNTDGCSVCIYPSAVSSCGFFIVSSFEMSCVVFRLNANG